MYKHGTCAVEKVLRGAIGAQRADCHVDHADMQFEQAFSRTMELIATLFGRTKT